MNGKFFPLTGKLKRSIMCGFLLLLSADVLWADGYIDPLTRFNCQEYIQKNYACLHSGNKIAKVLNSKGFKAYKSGDMLKAGRLFRCASEADGNHALAHYNYASVLSILYKQDEEAHSPCNDSEYLVLIEKHLKKSIQLDPKRRYRMKRDEDFIHLQDQPFYRLFGFGPNASAGDVVLRIEDWHARKQGVFPTSRISFGGDDTLTLKIFDSSDDVLDWSPPLKGRFKLTGDGITISFEKSISKFIRKNRMQTVYDNLAAGGNLTGTVKIKHERGVVTGASIRIYGLDTYFSYFETCTG